MQPASPHHAQTGAAAAARRRALSVDVHCMRAAASALHTAPDLSTSNLANAVPTRRRVRAACSGGATGAQGAPARMAASSPAPPPPLPPPPPIISGCRMLSRAAVGAGTAGCAHVAPAGVGGKPASGAAPTIGPARSVGGACTGRAAALVRDCGARGMGVAMEAPWPAVAPAAVLFSRRRSTATCTSVRALHVGDRHRGRSTPLIQYEGARDTCCNLWWWWDITNPRGALMERSSMRNRIAHRGFPQCGAVFAACGMIQRMNHVSQHA